MWPFLSGAVKISWFVLKKGSKCVSWKSFSWRARLSGADHSSTGSVMSSMDLSPAAKTATTAADSRSTLKENTTSATETRLLRQADNLCFLKSHGVYTLRQSLWNVLPVRSSQFTHSSLFLHAGNLTLPNKTMSRSDFIYSQWSIPANMYSYWTKRLTVRG